MNLPVLSRIGRVSPGRLALAGLFVGLLVVAAGLRFYDLPGQSLRHDEAAAANISRGALSEVIPDTRASNSSPILYPLALWVVQQVESTPFSIRLLPAAASVLTVAVMLFLLPRLGVNRWAAFLAALLTTLSVAAIEHAQDAREYSLDALLAVLLITGLLWYLRDGKKVLLCGALFLAPLLQYGLVLFGFAIIGAAIILTPPPPTLAAPPMNSYLSRVLDWLKARVALVWPAACFLAGCFLSNAVTLQDQWQEGGWSGWGDYYYQGPFDAAAVLGFSASRTWELLNYHLPQAVTILALVALALLLVASLKRRRLDAIATLALLSVGIALFAALLTLYPLGGIRQNLYLGPVIFLAAGVAIHWAAKSLAGLTRRAWLAPALTGAVAGVIALAGANVIQQDSPYRTDENIKSVLAILEERVREEDIVYADWGAVHALRFYQGKAEKPANYHYGTSWCTASAEPCLRDLADLARRFGAGNSRIWFVASPYNRVPVLADGVHGLLFERVAGGGNHELYLFTNNNEMIARVEEMIAEAEEILLRPFDVELRGNTLTYSKEPCAPADLEARFFALLYPVEVNDLPEPRQQYGVENLDFTFDQYGNRFDDLCLVELPLPEYALTSIYFGQYVLVENGFEHTWEGEIRLRESK